jgi:hypothetical protein
MRHQPTHLLRAQAEEIRYQEIQWKAGYLAAHRHAKWTAVGVVLAVILLCRRRRFPVGLVILWMAAAALCLWPVTLTVVVFELWRYRQRIKALANREPEPFPDWDEPERSGPPPWIA